MRATTDRTTYYRPPIASSNEARRGVNAAPQVRGMVLNHAALTDVGNKARPGDNETITHDPRSRLKIPGPRPVHKPPPAAPEVGVGREGGAKVSSRPGGRTEAAYMAAIVNRGVRPHTREGTTELQKAMAPSPELGERTRPRATPAFS